MTTHRLKTWPVPFAAVLDGSKRHEIRVDDRGFAVGDVLELVEWKPSKPTPFRETGRVCRRVVTYLSPGGTWGLPAGLCVMSIAEVV